MLTATWRARSRARRTSATCPACRLPMVGTKPSPRRSAVARRSSAMSWTTRIGSGAAEELAPALHAAHVLEQQLEIGLARDEVQVLGVDDQHRRGGVVVEEARVA